MDRPAKKEFIGYLHAFRGIAILSIMGAHAWSVLGWRSGAQEHDPAYRWLYGATESLFHGTTLFFALISGILVTRVLRGMPWKKFYKNKFTNVVTPYIVITLALTLVEWPGISAYLHDHPEQLGVPAIFNFPVVLAFQIVTGNAAVHLWYIPVLVVLYLLTPVLEWLLKQRNGTYVLVLAAVPLVVSRTVYPQLLSPQSIVYFLGAYGLGMYLGERLESMLAFARKYRLELLAVFVASLAVNFLLFLWQYTPGALFSFQQTVVYVNKLSAALLLLQWLHGLGERTPKLLYTLGTYAFSLYFLHFTVMAQLDSAILHWSPKLTTPWVAIGGLAVYAVGIAIALLLSMGLKKLFGRHSRMVIGA
jgi:peptidoglycan/LPS O-acetylase OafA/YrhL